MKDEPQFELSEETPREGFEMVDTLIVRMWRSRVWIALFVMVGLGVGAFMGAIKPNTYDSVGKLLIRAGAREQGSTESRVVGGERSDSMSGREAMQNELHLLSNPTVYENVARKVGPSRIFSAYDPANAKGDKDLATGWMHHFQSWWFARTSSEGQNLGHPPDHCEACVSRAAQALQTAIAPQAEPGSSVITVVATTNSAELSADLVDAFIAEALVHHQAVFSSEMSLGFLDEQVQTAIADAKQADEALSDYRVSCGFYDAEVQRGHLLTEVNTIETELANDNARLAALESEEAIVRSELTNEQPTTTLTTQGAVVVNPERSLINLRLVRLRDDLLALDGRRDLTSQQIESERTTLNGQIQATRAELESAPGFLEPGVSTQEVPNPRYTRLREQLDRNREESGSLRSSSSKRVERLAHVRERLVSLERCGPAMRVLETAAKQNKARLDKFLQARESVGTLSLLDSENMINLRPLQAATFPMTKSGPRRGRLVLIGGMLGLACGMGLGFLRQGLDRRVRTTQDVVRVLGTPVVGVVPDLRRKGPRARPQPPESTRVRA